MTTAETLFDIDEATPDPGCQFPELKPLSGYGYGCRCDRCRTYWNRYNRGYRTCAYCNTEYRRGTEGGTKFCTTCQENGVYFRHLTKDGTLRGKREPEPNRTCIRCSIEYRKTKTARWDLCGTCTSEPVFRILMGSLARHCAPDNLVLAVIDWPYCANEQCGAWLLDRAHRKREDEASSRYVYNFAIDHDHNCCPGDRSCGNCIRGILCRTCNFALPHTTNPTKLRGLADYLDNT